MASKFKDLSVGGTKPGAGPYFRTERGNLAVQMGGRTRVFSTHEENMLRAPLRTQVKHDELVRSGYSSQTALAKAHAHVSAAEKAKAGQLGSHELAVYESNAVLRGVTPTPSGRQTTAKQVRDQLREHASNGVGSVQTGPKGGQFYVSPAGQHVYLGKK
jgi:hypothetical protein